MSLNQDKRVAVFCGARPGTRKEYVDFARSLGACMGRQGLHLVYGAGGVGVMGAVANGVLDAGGQVTGVIPHRLHERERADRAPGSLFVVPSMHKRKALMYRLSSAFVVLPGGFGTLDELMEVATWNQLSFIDKPIVVVNYLRFFDPLLAMLNHLVGEGFLSERERRLIQVADDEQQVIDLLPSATTPPAVNARLA